ncbi:zinc finger protein [Haloactinomyces albus]|uniref:Zinc-finger n=1 Tax=Haloactinomyces albus TaxID=1352928 RepID=A0AAE3ZEZ1_9ACTN|nr:zinc finger protein [Haloactinomyces albus]MDR7301784.1 hypothetical protein [Haloactinomyces albus]
MLSEGLQWEGPVVWWQPVVGQRHALSPEVRPKPGQERDTGCGQSVTLIDPSDVDWLMPTCDDCVARAVELGEQRRQRSSQQAPSWESPAQAAVRRLRGLQ